MTLDKILIANRGEIACRIIRAARRLGKQTVSVYSTADVDALHVRLADQAVEIGPPPSTESYLDISKIVNAAKATGAQGIHPGYGFLSESYKFIEALDAEKIKFIGPSAAAIQAMGDKIGSKQLAVDSGVNTIPGFIGTVESPDHAVSVAKDIGFPVMVKASAGGGGKGMRIAWNEDDTREAFRLCTDEAKSSFGDTRLLIEKFVEKPRHVEFQVMGDQYGNVVYFPERDCSIQRRNQKVFEEAPSPFLTPELRKRMGEQAVALAKAVNYQSAGTVEFLVSGADSSFYFLEMNTRLQVEHPITEAVSGVNLAELMLKVADGEKLPLRQEDVSEPKGWAFESRVYAENPQRGFLPSIGSLRAYREPELPPDSSMPAKIKDLMFDHAGVRVDSGFEEGGKVQVYYDPLLSKLVVYGDTREKARQKMIKSLDAYVIGGVTNNLTFLRAIMSEKSFVDGDITTGFIQEVWKDGFSGVKLSHEDRRKVQAIAVWSYMRTNPGGSVVVQMDDEEINVTSDGSEVTFDDGTVLDLGLVKEQLCGGGSAALLSANISGEDTIFQRVGKDETGWGTRHFIFRGAEVSIQVLPSHAAHLRGICKNDASDEETNSVRAPMPGSVKSVSVADGDKVEIDEELLVLEAMKMQNIIRSQRDGKIKAIHCHAGDVVAADALLIEYEAK